MEKDHDTILDQLRKERQFKKIVEYIKQIPADEMTYDLAGRLASAYNNLYQYRNALRVLDKWAEEGEEDPDWHFRRGYAYFFSGYYDLAEEELHHSLALDENDCEAMYLLIILYQMNNEKHELYTRLLSRLKEINPELYRAEFGKSRIKLPPQGKSRATTPYGERWNDMANTVIKQWETAGRAWDSLDERSQQILSIALFNKAIREKGFLSYFCYSPEGCISYSYLAAALKHCAKDETLSHQDYMCVDLTRKAVIGMYQVIQEHIQAHVPYNAIPSRMGEAERQTLELYETAFRELYSDLSDVLYLYYHNDDTFEAQKPFPHNYKLCHAMYYKFGDEILQYTITRFEELIRRIESSRHTYRELQQYCDNLTLQLNNLAMLYELSETRRYTFNACITETLSYIIDWFDIDLDVYRALRRSTW